MGEGVVKDWLRDEDASENEGGPLTPSELALRKRMISTFIGSVIGVIVLMVLIAITVKVFSSASSSQIPNGCLRGKISECPSEKNPSSITLPGGLKLKDLESDPRTDNENKIFYKCLNGDDKACAARDSGG